MDQRLAKYVETELGALNGGSQKVLPWPGAWDSRTPQLRKFYVPKAAPWQRNPYGIISGVDSNT